MKKIYYAEISHATICIVVRLRDLLGRYYYCEIVILEIFQYNYIEKYKYIVFLYYFI